MPKKATRDWTNKGPKEDSYGESLLRYLRKYFTPEQSHSPDLPKEEPTKQQAPWIHIQLNSSPMDAKKRVDEIHGISDANRVDLSKTPPKK